MTVEQLSPTTTVRVRFFAAAAEAAGTDVGNYEFPARPTGNQLVAALSEQHGPELERVLSISSLLAAGAPVEDLAAALPALEIDVLPPFAGG